MGLDNAQNRRAYLLSRYNRQVPRYTSYPTAPHFRHKIDDDGYARLLRENARREKFSLYVHVPFCHALCHYCGCFTKVVNTRAPVEDYLNSLLSEISAAGARTLGSAVVSHLHFGGGSPNFLTPGDTHSIFEALRENFKICDNAEIAMEMDPRILSAEKISFYKDLGISRASLGIQDFQPDVQRAINRIQSYEAIEKCVYDLRGAGIRHLNFDLVYGLPLQTVESIRDNIQKTLKLKPDRIALFGYAHVPWMRPHQKLLEAYNLPDEEERFRQYEAARSDLVAAGYHAIGIDHFALPTDDMALQHKSRKLRRNFQGYTTDGAGALLGFGLSSISAFQNAYIQNTADPSAYRARTAAGIPPAEKVCFLSAEDILRRSIIEDLMCYYSVDLEAVCRRHSMPLRTLDGSMQNLTSLMDDGLVLIDGRRITATDAGRPFIRTICSAFDTYLVTSTQKHAHAI